MSIQRDLLVSREALAIMAQHFAASMCAPETWRGLMVTAIEQAKENIQRDESALQRNQQFDCITRIGYECEGEIPCAWQAGRTSK